MSTNRSRAAFNKAHNSREYQIMVLNEIYPPYWDEGINFHPRWKRGCVNPNKVLMAHEVREYRSWKYNRKTQYKQIKLWD